MNIRKRGLVILLIIIALAGFLSLTNPQDLPVGLLLVPFILFGALIYLSVGSLMELFRFAEGNAAKQGAVSLLFAILFTNFAVLQSIGRITMQDILLAMGITVIVVIYLAKFQLSPQ